jgi:glycosyltransferase involved in cell wall biosynthesis
MINTVCLDEEYSTTRLVVNEKPEIVNNLDDKFETVLFLPEGEGRKGEGGLRTRGYFKKSYGHCEEQSEVISKPLISIITVVYNGEKYLEETIQSIINQTYDNIEYIVIDGGSIDGTIDIIKKYEDRIDYWVSEQDKCMYDGINKGIRLAMGQIIANQNSDDYYCDERVISDVIKFFCRDNIDGIYGNIIKYDENKNIFKNVKVSQVNYKQLLLSRHCTFVPPPAFFLKKTCYKELEYFDITYRYASDFDLILKAIKKYDILHFDRFVSIFRLHDMSITSSGKIDSERLQVLSKNNIEDYSFFDKIFVYYFGWIKYKIINGLEKYKYKN